MLGTSKWRGTRNLQLWILCRSLSKSSFGWKPVGDQVEESTVCSLAALLSSSLSVLPFLKFLLKPICFLLPKAVAYVSLVIVTCLHLTRPEPLLFCAALCVCCGSEMANGAGHGHGEWSPSPAEIHGSPIQGLQIVSKLGLVSLPTVMLLLLAALPASASQRKVLGGLLQATPSHVILCRYYLLLEVVSNEVKYLCIPRVGLHQCFFGFNSVSGHEVAWPSGIFLASPWYLKFIV